MERKEKNLPNCRIVWGWRRESGPIWDVDPTSTLTQKA